MKIQITFDTSALDPIEAMKQLCYNTERDSEIPLVLEDILKAAVWGFDVQVLEFTGEAHE